MIPGERALRESAAVVTEVERAFWRLSGDAPLAYLHDVLTQDVAGLAPGTGALAALLSEKGRVLAEVRVLPLPDGTVLLDAEAAARPGVEEGIGRHAGLAGCELAEAAGYKLAAFRGPSADGAIADAGLAPPAAEEAAFSTRKGVLAVRVAWGAPGIDLIGEEAAVGDLVSSSGAVRATADELEAARIEAGRPRFGVDVTDELLINETPLLERAVSFTKGCYPGQESVARVHNLGGVRRLLRGLRSAGRISTDGDVVFEGSAVGGVTSTAPLPEGGSAAIALVRTEVAVGELVEAGGVEASVLALA